MGKLLKSKVDGRSYRVVLRVPATQRCTEFDTSARFTMWGDAREHVNREITRRDIPTGGPFGTFPGDQVSAANATHVAASSGVFLGCVGIEFWPCADDIDGADLVVVIIN